MLTRLGITILLTTLPVAENTSYDPGPGRSPDRAPQSLRNALSLAQVGTRSCMLVPGCSEVGTRSCMLMPGRNETAAAGPDLGEYECHRPSTSIGSLCSSELFTGRTWATSDPPRSTLELPTRQSKALASMRRHAESSCALAFMRLRVGHAFHQEHAQRCVCVRPADLGRPMMAQRVDVSRQAMIGRGH